MDRILSKPQLSQNPIFIVGFPRSGTTLLQSLLATQENIYSFQETHFFCTTMRFIIRGKNGFIDPGCVKAVFQNIYKKTDHKFSHYVTNEIEGLAKSDQLSIKLLFEFLVTDLLLKQIEVNQIKKINWVEKTPGHIFQMDIISDLYPNARFIEIIRNPLNAIYSCKTKFDDIDHITPSALAHRWENGFDTFKRFKETHPGKAYSVQFEDLVNDSQTEFNRICGFLGIIPNFKMLKDIQKTARQHVLKRETWKKDNVNQGIINHHSDYHWPLNEKLKIRYILRQELYEMGYSNGRSLTQAVFNGWMDLIGRLTEIKYLKPLKKPAKYWVKRVGLWPYRR